MFYKKPGKPEIGELVVCTVRKILPHSVFVSIDEYQNLEGMNHISEISPGRIRNLRDYVIEGKTIVCKVLNINQQGNIDLSLRRVGTGIMLNKLKGYKHAINSMTKVEIENPEIIEKETSRLQRISKGSGVSTTDIRNLIKQYKMLKEMLESGKSSESDVMDQKTLMKMAKKFGKKGMRM